MTIRYKQDHPNIHKNMDPIGSNESSWSVWVPRRLSGEVAFDRTVDRGMQFFDGLKVRGSQKARWYW